MAIERLLNDIDIPPPAQNSSEPLPKKQKTHTSSEETSSDVSSPGVESSQLDQDWQNPEDKIFEKRDSLYECVECARKHTIHTCKTRPGILNHFLTKHATLVEEYLIFHCVCDKRFLDSRAFNAHRSRMRDGKEHYLIAS